MECRIVEGGRKKRKKKRKKMDSGNVRLEEEAIPIKEDGKKNFQKRKREREDFCKTDILYVGVILNESFSRFPLFYT